MNRFGQKLRALREYYELSYRRLGAELEIDHTHLAKIEAGRALPSFELIVKIANYFEVTFDELMDDEIDLKL